MDITCVLPAKALNGERPGWHAGMRKLFWVDIREPALHAFDPSTGLDEAWEMPAWIGCYALTANGALVALRTGLYYFDIGTGALTLAAAAPFNPRRFIFNDGRCDRVGRFYAGPMYLPLKPGDQHGGPKAAPVWRYEPPGRWRAVSPDVQTSNGLAWSPDGRTMYHSDTAQKVIWACDYDEATGTVEHRRVFARVEVADDQGGPDGATVDRDGFYWCAVFANGCLLRFDPAGKLERRVEMPVKYPTMPSFGGPDLDILYVTSATWPIPESDRGKHPLEGGLFAVQAPVAGFASAIFDPTR